MEREAFEKADREKRELRLKELREAKNKPKTAVKDQNSENSESDEVKGTPQNDYQVLQAVNYLNSIGIIKNLKLEK